MRRFRHHSPNASQKIFTALDSRAAFRTVARPALYHWVGTMLAFGGIVFLWWALAEYHRPYYAPFFALLPWALTLFPFLSAVMLFLAEAVRGPSERGGYNLGKWAATIFSTRSVAVASAQTNWLLIRDDILSWLVRGFFLPINFTGAVSAVSSLRGREMELLSLPFAQSEYYLLLMIYAAIVLAVTPGYLFSSRLLHTETKGIDHSWFGWAITLACYSPFSVAVFDRLFDYRAPIESAWQRPWVTTFETIPVLLMTVGATIVVLELLHLWSEAQFGIRSSNLSNRGIITNGLFRFTKHPVYVTKCFGWALLWLPFIAGGNLAENIRLSVLFFGVCIIYILRSYIEERLLAKDPVYVQYAQAIDERGLFAWVGRLIPAMSFKKRMEWWARKNPA